MNSDKRATTRGLSPDEFDKMAERAKKNKVLQERLNNRNMNKNIKDYLHLYGIDCDILTPDGLGSVLVIYPKVVEVCLNVIEYQQVMKGRKGGGEMHYKYFYTDDLKLSLRPLSDMTDEEMEECGNMIYDFSNDEVLAKWEWQYFETGLDAEQFNWLLSKHFDLFGLIDAGLAIDKTTLKQNKN